MNRFFFLIVAVLLFTGCNDTEESSPFSDILNEQPYRPLTDSIQDEPGRDELYFRRAVLLNKNNFPEPALADFRKAWSLNKQESYAVAVSTLLLEKKKEEAVSFLSEAIKELPKSLFLKLNLARAYNEINKPDEALAVCNDILREQPDQVNTLMLQSDLLQQKGDTTAALDSLEKAHQITPLNRDLGYQLAYLYAESKNEKVIPLTDSLIAYDSLKLYADPYYIKGLYYSNINDRPKAMQWLNETIKKDYNYQNAYIEKGKLFFNQKNIQEALKTFTLVNTIDPAFPDSWYWIGRCQEALNQKAEAKLSYEKAYGLDKTFTEAKEAAERMP
jgi:tetratricopeptide (TPR) repeat protein